MIRNMHNAALALIAALALAGCAVAPQPGAARLGLRLDPASMGQAISVQQRLEVERAGSANTLDVALEIDPSRLELVGMAFGQRVLSLSYDGKELSSWRHVMLPAQVRAEDVLEDVQLTLWPADAVRSGLGAGWSIDDVGPRRTLSLDGAPVIVIDYSGTSRWQGRVVLRNLRYDYRLTIDSVASEGADR